MKLRNSDRKGTETHFVRACRNSCDSIREAVNDTKEALLREYGQRVEENGRLLRLALNEAEALAWQTDYPHLFFPVLATEKAQATVSWHQYQRAVQGSRSEIAFAE